MTISTVKQLTMYANLTTSTPRSKSAQAQEVFAKSASYAMSECATCRQEAAEDDTFFSQRSERKRRYETKDPLRTRNTRRTCGSDITAAFCATLVVLVVPMSTHAQSRWFALPATAAFETGDSFSDQGGSYRLYGVQACLRGTRFTNAHGQSRDCGEASLAMLVALTRDLKPLCAPLARAPAGKLFVTCVAQPTTGTAAGSRIDLGTALIASGYAFAAQGANGHTVHAPYRVAQELAQQRRLGLWAFPDLPDPNAILASTPLMARSGTAPSAIRP